MDGRREHQEPLYRQGEPYQTPAAPAAMGGLKPLTPLAAMPARPAPAVQTADEPITVAPAQGSHALDADAPPYGEPAHFGAPSLMNPPFTSSSDSAHRQTAYPAPAATAPTPTADRPPQAPARAGWQPAGLRPATMAPVQPATPVPVAPQPTPAPPAEPEPVRRVLMQTLPQQSRSAQSYPAYPTPAYYPNGTADADSTGGERTRRRRAASRAAQAGWQDDSPAAEPEAIAQAQPAATPVQAWPGTAQSATAQAWPGTAQTAATQAAAGALQSAAAFPGSVTYPVPQASSPGGVTYPGAATPDYRYLPPEQTPLRTAAQADALEEDSGRYAAIDQPTLAEPRTVPTYDALTPRPARKRRGWLAALLVLLLAAGGVYAAYQTGLLAQWLPGLFPGGAGTVPAVFGQQTGGVTAAMSVTPAAQVAVPALQEFLVENPDATAPAVVRATLLTNAATTSVRLFTQDNTTIYTVAYAAPKGDGFLWQVEATFAEAYSGDLLAYLRDAAGQWTLAEGKAAVTVR